MFSPSWTEMLVVGVIALLLFGKRLPEVARSMGKGMREFKEGLSGMQDEFNGVSRSQPARDGGRLASRPAPADHDADDDRGEFTAPKFEPPKEPVAQGEVSEANSAV